MGIRFTDLSDKVKKQIADKLDYPSFLSFALSSRDAKDAADRVTTKLFIGNNENPCGLVEVMDNQSPGGMPLVSFNQGRRYQEHMHLGRLSFVTDRLDIQGWLTQEYCQKITELVKAISAKAQCVEIDSKFFVGCSPDALNELLEAVAAEAICYHQLEDGNTIPGECMQIPAIKQIKKIFVYAEPLNTDEILALQAEDLTLLNCNDITSFGLNIFLQEYLHGNRDIKNVKIFLSTIPEVDEIFEGIEFESISTSDNRPGFEIGVEGRKLRIWINADYIHMHDPETDWERIHD